MQHQNVDKNERRRVGGDQIHPRREVFYIRLFVQQAGVAIAARTICVAAFSGVSSAVVVDTRFVTKAHLYTCQSRRKDVE